MSLVWAPLSNSAGLLFQETPVALCLLKERDGGTLHRAMVTSTRAKWQRIHALEQKLRAAWSGIVGLRGRCFEFINAEQAHVTVHLDVLLDVNQSHAQLKQLEIAAMRAIDGCGDFYDIDEQERLVHPELRIHLVNPQSLHFNSEAPQFYLPWHTESCGSDAILIEQEGNWC